MVKPLLIDGKEYISASRAAHLTGYTSDYIGQLCRAGKIPGKLVGRNWFVDIDSLDAYKRDPKNFSPENKSSESTNSDTRNIFAPTPTPQPQTTKTELKPIRSYHEDLKQYLEANGMDPRYIPNTEKKEDKTKTKKPEELAATTFLAAEAAKRHAELDKRKAENKTPVSNSSKPVKSPYFSRKAVALVAILLVLGSTAGVLGYTSPDIAQKAMKSIASKVSDLEKGFLSLFDTEPLAIETEPTQTEEDPTIEEEPIEVASNSPSSFFDISALREELKDFIRVQTSKSSVVVYSSPAIDLEELKKSITPVYTTITRQSDSDVSAFSNRLYNLANGGSLSDNSITRASITNSSFEGSATLANLIFNAATGTSATTTSFFSTTASSTNLYSSLANIGTLNVSGDTTVTGNFTVGGDTTTIGQLLSMRIPTLAHVFAPSWPNGTSNASDATIYINPASADPDTNIFAAAVGGVVKFLVDAEGDVYANNLVLSGSTSQGATNIAGNLSVQDNTTLGDAPTDLTTISGALKLGNLTTAQRDGLASSAGLSIFNTSLSKMQVYDGSEWKNVGNPEIGGEVTDGTANSVLFIDGSGNLAQDNTNFTFDDSLNRLTVANAVFTTSTSTSATSTDLYFSNSLTGPGSFIVNSSGNVGVGVTSPTARLDIYGSSIEQKIRDSSSTGSPKLSFYQDVSERAFLQYLNGVGTILDSDSSIYFRPNNTASLRLSSSGGLSLGSSYVGTDAGAGNAIISGNVGIGTDSPSEKLHVAGNLLVTGNSTTTNATTTNQYASKSTVDNLIASVANLSSLLFTNATGTNATTTNLYSEKVAGLTGNFSTSVTSNTGVFESVQNSALTTNLNLASAGVTNKPIDLMEYSTDASIRSAYITSAPGDATGGSITHSGGNTIHTFTSSGTFTPQGALSLDYLLVAGGGGGATGGGGAGGMATGTAFAVTATSYPVTVGAGGSGQSAQTTIGVSGGNSTFNGLTAIGGGGGAPGAGGGMGANGGSGGGGYGGGVGGAGTSGQGKAGGNGAGTGAAGGGGAGSIGSNAYATQNGGNGGAGATSSITGSSVTYAGGGGGGGSSGNTPGTGGVGGGANGTNSGAASNATPNTGGGGGGSTVTPTPGTGGDGGSGIVVLSYTTPTEALLAYSEASTKTQGSFALKAIASSTDSLNETLTHTISSPINLSGYYEIKFDIRSNRTGSNIKVALHDSGGTTTEVTPNIASAGVYQEVTIDVSGVANADKDAIDEIIVTIVNADAENIFYIDNLRGILGGNSDIVIATNSIEALRVNGAGGVGIGTDSPLSALDVNGGVTIGSYAGTELAPTNGLLVSGSVGIATNSFDYNIPPTFDWTPRTAAENNFWKTVTYGNGQFVAVAQTGTNRVMTSPDGITWTPRTAAQANNWNSVVYGGGTYVAVARDGTNRVMTSTDGVTWTARTAAEANSWYSVTYGNGLFVAVSSDGTNRVMTSPDGTTWTSRSASENNGWKAVTYGNGLFVAVAQGGTNRVMTSPDGTTWTSRSASEANSWQSVTYGNGLFVAVSIDGTNRVMTSTDGYTWSARTSPENNAWFSVAYGDGHYVAVSYTGTNRVMTSTDGIIWTARSAAAANSWQSVAYGDGKFVAVTYDGTDRVMTTSSGEQTLTPHKFAVSGSSNLGGDVIVSGKIGIGTTDANGYNLNVAGSINAQEIRVNGAVLTPGSGSNWTVSGSNVYRLVGNVGLGTATPGTIGSYNLGGSEKAFNLTNTSGRAYLAAQGSGGAALSLVDTGGASNDKWLDLYLDNGVGTWRSLTDAGGLNNNILTMDLGSGNVGISTTTPGSKLSISGGVSIGSSYGGAAPSNGLIVQGNTGIGNTSPLALLHVGAGTTAPGYGTSSRTLYVSGAGQTDLILRNTNDSVVGGVYAGSSEVAVRSATAHPLKFLTSNTERASISSTGSFSVVNLVSCGGVQTNASGTMSCTSDANLKDIESDFTPGLSAINKITPQTYSWKEDSGLYDGGVLYSGFIAQDIQIAIPDAVNIGANGYRQINTTTILATVVNAIKELDNKVTYVASTTNATTTPQELSQSVFASASDVLRQGVYSINDTIVKVYETAIYATTGMFERVFAREVNTDKLCVGSVCVSEEQFMQMVYASTGSVTVTNTTSSTTSTTSSSTNASSTPSTTATSTPSTTASSTSPAETATSTPSVVTTADDTASSTPSTTTITNDTDTTENTPITTNTSTSTSPTI